MVWSYDTTIYDITIDVNDDVLEQLGIISTLHDSVLISTLTSMVPHWVSHLYYWWVRDKSRTSTISSDESRTPLLMWCDRPCISSSLQANLMWLFVDRSRHCCSFVFSEEAWYGNDHHKLHSIDLGRSNRYFDKYGMVWYGMVYGTTMVP